ncbi:MAG TPA: AlpA family phage regulatory protein [Phycisphaerales bacterium]|nr:AlpA family phage regulatory protein [Phycisphaerales bacterium]
MNSVSERISKLKLLTYKHLTEMFGVDRKTIYRWVDAGRLPQPIRITARTVRFDAEQVLRCLKDHQG